MRHTSLHRDSFAAKVPGLCPVLASGNTNALYCRAVSCKAAHNILIPNAQARVLQLVPATVPSLQNTCFFARPDSAIWPTLLYHDKPCPYAGTLASRDNLYHTMTNPTHLPGLWHLVITLSIITKPARLPGLWHLVSTLSNHDKPCLYAGTLASRDNFIIP